MLLASSSEASQSVPAFLGQAQNASNYGCFPNSGGAVTQGCSGTGQFCVALPVDSTFSTSHTVQVTVRAPDINHNLSCFAHTWTRDGFFAGGSQRMSPSVFGSPQIVNLGGLSVPAAGVLYACCDIAPSATLFSVDY